jgi:hypothetical protein
VKLGCAALAVLLIFGASSFVSTDAEAADLTAVKASLMPLRERSGATAGRMGPEFLAARDGLRDWIAARLSSLPRNGDTQNFAKTLNAEIAAADLGCVEAKAPGYNRCTSPGALDARGYLGVVDVDLVRDVLLVHAETGVVCGFDETLYAFEWEKDRWRLLLDASQKPDAKGLYTPERIQQVVFSNTESMPRDELRLAATGATPSCDRTFTPVHARVWTMKRLVGSSLIAESREERAYIGRRDPAISARFEEDTLLMEMDVASIDPKRRSRVAVQRLLFSKAGVSRAVPLALTPRDFVEEWVRAPWATASLWTQAGARAALEKIHADANGATVKASFSGPTERCEKDPNVMQVGLRLPNGERFFRLRRDDAGVFEMRSADSAAAPDCARPDSGLDTAHSLFSK